MAKVEGERPVKSSDRTRRIREEIIKAKEVAGIAPPRLIPRGATFRSESSSRPAGAVSRELDSPVLRGEANMDFIATSAEPEALGKPMAVVVGAYRKAILKRAEAALDALSAEHAPRLIESIAEQLNLAAMAAPGDIDVAKLLAKFNEIRFADVNFNDEQDKPGGGAPSC